MNLTCFLVFCWFCVICVSDGQVFKLLSHRVTSPVCPRAPQYTCDPTSPFRSINGACNNLEQPWWGQANSPYKRLLSPHYDDRLTEPRTRSASNRHSFLPNARTVANEIFRDSSKSDKSPMFTLLLPYLAQLVSYDISATAPSLDRNGEVEECRCNSRDKDCFNIPIPRDDKMKKDQKCMSVVRSLASVRQFDCSLGPREQLNKVTHWLDLSFLYGSDQEEANNLRTLSGGLLKSFNNTRTGELFFALNQTVDCKYSKYSPRYYNRQQCYITGDPRTEDNAVLTSLVTIFLREHNRIATELAVINPLWTDERLYQETRRIVIAIYQNIIYSEFLPAVIGKEASISFGLPTLQSGYFTRYSSSIYPQVNNEFATAASRFFHTMLPVEHTLVGRNKRDKVSKSISYFQFNNQLYERQMNPLLRGVLTDPALPVKPHMNKYLQDWLWNELFYDEETKRWSLSALNIQQGRDHGLAGYNKYRKLCGLREAKSFNDLTNIPEKIVQQLKRVYSCVDDIDLFVGLVSEKPLKDALVGQTAACIIGKQFRDLKFGDRFYFENGDPAVTKRAVVKRDISNNIGTVALKIEQLLQIRKVSMARLVAENSNVGTVQRLAFYLPNNNLNRPLSQSNNLNLSSSPDGLYLNCTSLFAYNSTTGYFYWSTTNTTADYVTFYSDFYSPSGLSGASIDAKCFPLNRTAIVTITGNVASSTNINLGDLVAKTNNCSLFVYIFNTNSTSFYKVYSESYISSTFGLTIADVKSQLHVENDLEFYTYDFSSGLFAIDSVDHVYIDEYIEFYPYDNSSVTHTVSNVNLLEIGSSVYIYTQSYNGDYVYANQTVSKNIFRYSDIKRVEIYSFYLTFSIGGRTEVLIENVDNFTVTGYIAIQSEFSITDINYINVQFSIVFRDIGHLTNEGEFFIDGEDTFIIEIVFEDIEQLSLEDKLYLKASLGEKSASTNFSVSFRNIGSVTIYDLSFTQDNSGRVSVELYDIGSLVIEDEITSDFESARAINVHFNISQIGNLTVANFSFGSQDSGQTSINFEKIGVLKLDIELTTSLNTNSTMSFNIVECDQVELEVVEMSLQGESTSVVIDRIRNLTISDFNYDADTLSSDKSSGQNSLVISNVQLLAVPSVSIDFQNGVSSADFVNISSIAHITDLILSSNNSLAAFNIGPGIQQLNAETVTITKGDNSTTMQWNLDQINSVNIGNLSGTLDGVVNVSLSNVATTVITDITAAINLSPGLLFKFFDATNSFDFVNVPGGAGTTIKTVRDSSCSCTSVENFP